MALVVGVQNEKIITKVYEVAVHAAPSLKVQDRIATIFLCSFLFEMHPDLPLAWCP